MKYSLGFVIRSFKKIIGLTECNGSSKDSLKTDKLQLDSFAKFKNDFDNLSKQAASTTPRFPLNWDERFPKLKDNTTNTYFDRHYIYHTAWAARVLKKINPAYHLDISSTLYFSSIVSAFIPIRFYDYRPAELALSNLSSEAADLLSLPFETESINSISCMHTVEHVGLGRYGDPIDYDGDLKAMKELQRVVAFGGNLLLVVPTGKPKIVFNAHRIYSYKQVIDAMPNLHLESFSLIPDDSKDGGLIDNATEELANNQAYGCGCYWFKKI